VAGAEAHGAVARDQRVVVLAPAAVAGVDQQLDAMRPIGEVVDRHQPPAQPSQQILPGGIDPVMVDDDDIGQKAARDIGGVIDLLAQSLGVGHGQKTMRGPVEAAQDGGRGARLDEGAGRAALRQRPGQGEAAHHMPAADLGPGVGEEQDAWRVRQAHGVALGENGATY